MAKTVLIQSKVAAKNIDSYNRTFISDNAVQNGAIFQSGTISSDAGKGEVFTISAVAASVGLQNLWMAYSPEIVTIVTATGKKFKGLDVDPRDFENIAGEPFSGFKPQVGDIIHITVDGLNAAYNSADNKPYAVATSGSSILTWNASAIAGLTFKYLATVPMTISESNIRSNNATAYLLECVAIA